MDFVLNLIQEESQMNRPIAYLGNFTVLTRLLEGPKIYLDTRDISITPHLILDGYWERWVSKLFFYTIQPGMTVLDIGANCGYYTLLAAMKVGRMGTVHSFEPNPFHHNNILKSLSINGFSNTYLHKVALSNKNGEIDLYVPIPENIQEQTDTGSASLFRSNLNTSKFETIKVPAVELSSYLPNLTKVDVIKLDIEGAEPLVMESLFKIIDNSGSMEIFMEYYPKRWVTQGYDPELILNGFLERGFCFHIIDHNSNIIPVGVKELASLKNENTYLDIKIGRKVE